MQATKVSEGIYQLTVNVENILFEGLWEIPNGVCVNSYIVKGEKTAIVDGVCGWDGVPETLFRLLEELDIKPEDIEYLVINHMEPDHSGWIEDLKQITNDFKIVCTQKASELLDAFYGHTDNIRIVKDGDSLDLGNGRLLKFYETPNVHWPDAMVTFDESSGTLFSCDIFGSYGIAKESNYDDCVSEEELLLYEVEAERYYANIVSAFSAMAKKALIKCATLPIKVIAPGHGLVWRKNPQRIIDDYSRYVSYSSGQAEPHITLIWGSMYGMTQKAVKFVTAYLEEQGVTVFSHRLPETSWGQVLASAWMSSGIILAMPTYEYKMFPPVAAVLEELGRKKVVNRKAFRLGSYGWSGGAQKDLDEIMEKYKMKWDFIPSVEFLGSPTEEDLEAIKLALDALVASGVTQKGSFSR